MSLLRAVYGLVVFLSAFLLFLGEPMAAKGLLPPLGGSSAVWVTCLVFFQAVLLLGYGYAHWMARREATWIHVGLLAAAALMLLGTTVFGILLGSMGMDLHLSPSAAGHPVGTIFAVLGVTIGLPFFVLSSTSPLLQVWWVRAQGGTVPYRLFALSNAGSLLALAAYPVLVEPHVSLTMQRVWWAVGFVVYAALCGWVAVDSIRKTMRLGKSGASAQVKSELAGSFDSGSYGVAVSSGLRRWMWFLLPMGAAMQLSAVSAHLSQDIAAIPLLWILPLATYLVTFVLAFELPRLYQRPIVIRVLAVMLGSLAYSMSKLDTRLPVGLAVLFFLVEVFVSCWFCHAEVYRLRPMGAGESTLFYLLVAAGGVVGTFAVGIACPLVFRSNYDLAIAYLVTALLAATVTWRDGWALRALWVTGSALLVLLLVALHMEYGQQALVRERNFYGSLRVIEAGFDDQGLGKGGSASTGSGPVRVLMNGRIRHGMQMLDAERQRVPTTYYGTDSGAGVVLRNCCGGRPKNVGVVGLGVGTLAAYGKAGDRFRFYEINPLVEPIARNLFSFLRETPAAVTVVNGDGRASLKLEPAQEFDVLVVDAFSGDAIPLHLLTREAMEVYRRQLAPGGVIAFHVSNSYLNLAPEIAAVADSEGMTARAVESFEVPAEGAYRATWVLVSADAGFFAKPGVEAAVSRIAPQPGLRVWTDDYSSLLPVLKLGR